jgi:hypothetical protein
MNHTYMHSSVGLWQRTACSLSSNKQIYWIDCTEMYSKCSVIQSPFNHHSSLKSTAPVSVSTWNIMLSYKLAFWCNCQKFCVWFRANCLIERWLNGPKLLMQVARDGRWKQCETALVGQFLMVSTISHAIQCIITVCARRLPNGFVRCSHCTGKIWLHLL